VEKTILPAAKRGIIVAKNTATRAIIISKTSKIPTAENKTPNIIAYTVAINIIIADISRAGISPEDIFFPNFIVWSICLKLRDKRARKGFKPPLPQPLPQREGR
jgi:hypothetical protein